MTRGIAASQLLLSSSTAAADDARYGCGQWWANRVAGCCCQFPLSGRAKERSHTVMDSIGGTAALIKSRTTPRSEQMKMQIQRLTTDDIVHKKTTQALQTQASRQDSTSLGEDQACKCCDARDYKLLFNTYAAWGLGTSPDVSERAAASYNITSVWFGDR